jgi:hypothetical protein
MNNKNLISFVGLFVILSLSCNFLSPATAKNKANGPVVDFESPGEPLNVTVQLDEASTTSSTISPSGGSLSLTAADGTVFTLDVPAKALEADTLITMTAVKSLDGAPLDSSEVAAVQLEPSGLHFKELLTLTVVPAQDIPIKNQLMFAYEGSGQDYHLAVVDPKSKDIKIKLLNFSGAGVGSASDRAWAANLLIQAGNAETRLAQKYGEATQAEHVAQLLGAEELPEGVDSENIKKAIAAVDDYEDQVLLKKLAAAELDCQHAQEAVNSLILYERYRQLVGYPESPKFVERALKLAKIAAECAAPYRIVGGLDDWQTDTSVCDIMKPFTLTSPILRVQFSGGLLGTYSYSGGPFGAAGGSSYSISLPDGVGKPGTMTGGGTGCVETPLGKQCSGGTERYTLTPLDPGAACTQ